MRTQYTEIELDALRELANVGSGNAATSLSSLLGRSVDVSVPTAAALALADAIDATGPADSCVTGVIIPLTGELEGTALMLFGEADVDTLAGLLGMDPADELVSSALGEVVNILGAAYIGALSAMTGLQIELGPPQSARDMLGAIMGSILAGAALEGDMALLLDSALIIEGEACSLSFLLLPSADGIGDLLERLGLGA